MTYYFPDTDGWDAVREKKADRILDQVAEDVAYIHGIDTDDLDFSDMEYLTTAYACWSIEVDEFKERVFDELNRQGKKFLEDRYRERFAEVKKKYE